MKRLIVLSVGILLAGAAAAQLPKLDDVLKRVESLPKPSASGATVGTGDLQTDGAGIREALAVGSERAVQSLSKQDGYFGNQAVKILMPSGIQKVAELARMAGYQKQVDAFVLSMNRAAEAAVPQAAKFFGDAIREMTLEDVRGILTGGDTAATDFFRRRTHDKLYAAFKPVVSRKVDEVGTTRAYKDMMSRYEKVPLAGAQSLDLDHYVTEKALDGLYRMVAEEEKRIRTNPLARTTDLLKTVFGR
jgi:hypothetical protein